MTSRPTTASSSKAKTIKQLQPVKQPGTANAFYSGAPSLQRTAQQQRYFGSASLRRSAQSKRGGESTPVSARKKCDTPVNYHPWQSEYSKIIIREKKIKSMTKDPYTPISRLISHAVGKVTNEIECCSALIPAKAVGIHKVNVQYSPQPSRPPRPPLRTVVRYVRRGELMPSERVTRTLTSMKPSAPSQIKGKNPIIPVKNINNTTGVPPTIVAANRLIDRTKTRTDPVVIRRPPRKLMMKATHETIMPLSVYG